MGIRTTVVGSYPVPAWLQTQPSAPNLRDAILVAVRTQELAGRWSTNSVLKNGSLVFSRIFFVYST